MFLLNKTDFQSVMTFLFVLNFIMGIESWAGSINYDLATRSNFPMQKVLKLIRDPSIPTMDALIGALPEDMRENAVLAYESHSLQHADPANPRVILFSPLADLMVAFTCDPEDCTTKELKGKTLPSGFIQAGFDSMEFIVFDWKENRFMFDRREFARRKVASSGPPKKPEGPRGASVTKKCGVCHGGTTSPRPNWDPYRLWRGFYGEFDDGLKVDEAGPGSTANLAKFIRSAPGRLRYRHLRNLEKNYDRSLKLAKGTVYAGERNSLFTQRLGALNARRVLSLAKKHPQFPTFLPLLLASLIDHDSGPRIAQYFPEGLLPLSIGECLSREQDLQKKTHIGAIPLLRILLGSTGSVAGLWHTMFPEREEFKALYSSLEFDPFALPGNFNVLFTDLLVREESYVRETLKGRAPGAEIIFTPQLQEKLRKDSRGRIKSAVRSKGFEWSRRCSDYTKASMPSGSN